MSIRNINNIAVSFTTGPSTSTRRGGIKRRAKKTKNVADGKNLLSFKVKYFPVEAGIKTIKVINTKS